MGKNLPARGNRQCKSPEVGMCLRSSKEARDRNLLSLWGSEVREVMGPAQHMHGLMGHRRVFVFSE